MRTRAALAAAASVTLIVLGFGLAGCDSATASLPPALAPSTEATTTPADPGDPGCNPRASLAPTTPLPQAGKMPAGSKMAEIQKRGRLILGTSQDTLLFSSRNPFTGKVEGFDVDMARQIAQAIFGDPDKIQIKVIRYDERVSSVVDGSVDLVADTMTANCARWASVDFSAIYYDAGQRVLVASTSGAKSIDDLGGRRVCAAAGSTSYDNIGKVPSKPIPVAEPTFGDCLVAFQQNQVDAISTDDSILAGMAAQDPYARIVGPRFTDEPYGMAISKKSPDFTRFVNAVLARNMRNGTWAKTYTHWLGRFGPPPQPPKAEYR
jgi:polar amino acid transport system substrate-binding protein